MSHKHLPSTSLETLELGRSLAVVHWIVGLAFVASLLWGGVAGWRLWREQQRDAFVRAHLQRQQLRQLAVDLQQQTSVMMDALWPARRDIAPSVLARQLQRRLSSRGWFWGAVVLDARGRMLWPSLPWEGPGDQALLQASKRDGCAAFLRHWQRTQAGLAARLAAGHQLLRREPQCPLRRRLRRPLLQELHLRSQGRRRWLYVASSSRAFWVMAGPSHLLLLRLLHGKHVGVALPLRLFVALPSLLSSSNRQRVWIAPVPGAQQTAKQTPSAPGAADWFPLSGALAGYAVWTRHHRPVAASRRGAWMLLSVSLLVTWAALLALVLLGRKRALWEGRRQALFAAITHELKTPVAAQIALLDTIQRLHPDASQTEHHQALQRETIRLQQLLQNVLALHHDVPPAQAFQRVDLTALTHRLIEDLEPQAEARRLELTCDQRTPLWVSMEPTSAELALRNLIDNAIKYTPPGGWIRMDISPGDEQDKEADQIHWSIRDSGPGIPEALQGQIFAPFVRGERRDVAGSGLGLPLAHKIMSQQGGRLVLLPGSHATGGFRATFRKAPATTVQE